MTSRYIMVTNKLYLDVRNYEYIIKCEFIAKAVIGPYDYM